MATRIAADFPCYISLAKERPRAFIDCGFQYYSFWVDDLGDLRDTLTEAVRHDGLPERAASIVYERAAEAIGSYEDDDFGAAYDPPVPTVRPKFVDWPATLIALTWGVYIVFTVECVAWCVRALWRGIN